MHDIYATIPELAEFLLAEKQGRVTASREDGYILFKYSMHTTFTKDWDAVTENARGIIFDETTGLLVALGFPKFWNWGELGDHRSALPAQGLKDAEILTKVDGSFGLVWLDRDGELRVTTPGGLGSEQGYWATNFIRRHKNAELIRHLLQEEYRAFVTEIVYPGSAMVVKYDYKTQAGLHLTAAQPLLKRGGQEARYATHEELAELGGRIGFPVTGIHHFEAFDDIRTFLETVENFEGFVLHYPVTGFRLKMKGDEYVHLHRIISRIHPNRIDEALSLVPEQKDSFSAYIEKFRETISLFPEEHVVPYEHALDLFTEEIGVLEDTAKEAVAILRERYHELEEKVFKIFMSRAAQDLNGEDQHLLIKDANPRIFKGLVFAILRGRGAYTSKVALSIWKKVRSQVDFHALEEEES